MADIVQSLSSFLHWGIDLFHGLVEWLVNVIGVLGYPGIVMLMFLESSFFPFPSEVVLPPAGYLASQGKMNLIAIVLCGILGSVLGALFNYYIAIRWGRKFFDRFGKYFFVSPEAIDKAETFFEKHGHISTFTARLLPVIRQYVSLPAGLARMNLTKFCAYAALGSGIWVVILTLLGYWIGNETDNINQVLQKVTVVLVLFCALLILGYVYVNKRRRQRGKGV